MSLNQNVSSCVRINGHCTDWFENTCGLRQGCSLSPLLFNMSIDDLVGKIKATGKGIQIDDDLLCILLYANDIVLMADNESDLQYMLDV